MNANDIISRLKRSGFFGAKKIFTLLIFANSALLASENDDLKLLTASEAAAIVESRAVAKEVDLQAEIQAFGRAEIIQSKVVQSAEGTITVNAVKPITLVKPIAKKSANLETQLSQAEWAVLIAEQQQHWASEHISMGANVYGDEYSEITWRDRESNSEFIVWSNVSLNYLRPIISIPDDDYDYTFFGFVTNYTREGEANRIKLAEAHGYHTLESRWKMPPVEFSPDQFEYVVVVADESTPVPEKLYRQLDAVLGYYVANRERLEVEHYNSVAIQKARREYLEENPPAPKRTMINFWKIEDKPAAGRK